MFVSKKANRGFGFTLAEILITLTIVGVIAVITLPALFTNVEDFKWNSARQKMVYNIREAARRISFQNAGIGGLGTAANFRDELSKYLSVTKSCNTVTDCFPATIKDVAGNTVTTPTSGATLGISFHDTATPGAATGLILNNGASLSIMYNSACTENDPVISKYSADQVCANIIFDINGFTLPSQVGKDIGFISVINPKNTVVAGVSPDIVDYTEGATITWDMETAQTSCLAKGDTWHLPTKDELISLYFNKKIINIDPVAGYWSSTEYALDADRAWLQGTNNGYQSVNYKVDEFQVRCIRR